MSDLNPASETQEILSRVAQRLEANPQFMADVLVRYRRQEKLTESDLATQLGISAAAYTRLAMCKRPVSDRPGFGHQVRAIAEYVGCDSVQLAQLINQVAAVEQIRTASDEMPHRSEARSATRNLGWLAAARDREADDSLAGNDQDAPANPDSPEAE